MKSILYLDNLYFALQIMEYTSSAYFQITMPSGAYVTARIVSLAGYGVFMNVMVYPLKEDYRLSTGLCGNYNGNPNDDLVPLGSNTPDTSNDDTPLNFPLSFL